MRSLGALLLAPIFAGCTVPIRFAKKRGDLHQSLWQVDDGGVVIRIPPFDLWPSQLIPKFVRARGRHDLVVFRVEH